MDAPANVVLPSSAYYPPIVSLPSGLKTIKLRQPTISALAIGNPAAVETQIVLPHLDGCFLDPTTTSIEIDASITIRFSVAAAAPIFFSPSNSNGGIIGGCASLWQRYQVWLNNAQLSDDISEFGLVSYYSIMLSLNTTQKRTMHQLLGLHPTFPEGIWGTPFHGQDMHHRATVVFNANSGLLTNAGANTIIGTDTSFGVGKSWRPVDGHFFTSAPLAVNFDYVQHFSWAMMLPGILGSGNAQLYPLFNGPTRISLYSDLLTNYWQLDFATTQSSAGKTVVSGGGLNNAAGQEYRGAYSAGYTPTTQTFTIHAINFVGDYVKCDPASFAQIMEQLALPNLIVMKTVAWNVTQAPLAASLSGTVDSMVPCRKASVKLCLVHCSPQGTLSSGMAYNLWGKYGSINPNFTAGTHMLLNGTPYPLQTYDIMNRPQEHFVDVLKSLQTWHNDAVKPSLHFRNWAVCDSIDATKVTASGVNYYAGYGVGATPHAASYGGIGMWRNIDTTTFRTGWVSTNYNILTGAPVPVRMPSLPIYPISAADLVDSVAGTSVATVSTTALTAMTDKTPFLTGSGTIDKTMFFFLEGTSSSENSESGPANAQSGAIHGPMHNQFFLAFDFEHQAKASYLSGTSTLTGSWFFKMNILSALRLAYSLYYIVCFDQIVILDVALRTANIKS